MVNWVDLVVIAVVLWLFAELLPAAWKRFRRDHELDD